MNALLAQYRAPLMLFSFVATLTIGVAIGWHLRRPADRIVVEKAQPAIALKDARVLERAPAAEPPPKIVAAAKEVKGAKLDRAARITIQPAQPGCDDLDLELGVLRMKDDTQRVVVRSDDAKITSGVDIPLAEPPPRAPKWSAGALYNPTDQTYGAYVDRDIGPFRAGVDVFQDSDRRPAVMLRIGIRF